MTAFDEDDPPGPHDIRHAELAYSVAHAYVMAGEPDAAIDLLEQLVKTPWLVTPMSLRVDPVWAPLQSHPRFQRHRRGDWHEKEAPRRPAYPLACGALRLVYPVLRGRGSDPAIRLVNRQSFSRIGMRLVLQRVSHASVTIAGKVAGSIERGFCILAGFTHTDTPAEVDLMAEKVAGLRLFADVQDKMNLALEDVGGALLVISQFTLYGDAQKGRRPSFIDAARPEVAIPLYERFVAQLRARGLRVETGEFGAMMQVEIHNDGPVTLVLERAASGS